MSQINTHITLMKAGVYALRCTAYIFYGHDMNPTN